jgi:hypothetical protein
VGCAAFRIVQCTDYVSLNDEWHHARLFTQVRNLLPRRRFVYNRTLEEHLEHMHLVLGQSKEEGLK